MLATDLSALFGRFERPARRAGVSGDYVEIRSCDVITGPCFANGEMQLTGGEAVLGWSVREGRWRGSIWPGWAWWPW